MQLNYKLNAKDEDEYIIQFQELLSLPEAREIQNILYSYRLDKPIPRMIGESTILYIGKTKWSLSDRYNRSSVLKLEREYFQNVYRHVMGRYGAISIWVESCEKPSDAEYYAIQEYYTAHREYPPLNRSTPRKPKDK